ncbi:AMP-binding protein, partial [Kitasatospora phosalacinea]
MYLTQCLHRALQQFPDRPMTVCGERVRTTRESVDRVARLAAALQDLGVRPGDRIGILALNSDRVHEAFFATWWSAAAAQPMNVRWSPAELAHAVQDSGTELLLVDDAFAPLVPDLRERCPGLRTVVHCGDGPTPDGLLAFEDLVARSAPVPDLRAGGEDLALLLYTGGTTGVPKGVAIAHRGLLSALLGSMLALGTVETGGTTLVPAPLFHVAALCSWYAQTVMGGTQVFLPAFTPAGFLDAVQRHRATTCILVPTMVQLICDQEDVERYDLSSLRSITYGGASSSDALLERAMKALPGAAFSQGYGMTETGVLTVLGREEHRVGGPRLRSAGRATPTVELAVVDPAGELLPAGGVGEVVTRGDHVMLGYWRRPQETAESLRDG